MALIVALAAVPIAFATPALAASATPAPTAARTLFRIADPRIDEASGLALGRVSPGVVYVQNDSGDSNRFFALDRAGGATVAVVTVPGATNVDWEDIATAPDAAGTPSVWLADIGDNEAQRREIEVYRVAEPRLSANDRDRAISTDRPQVWRLRYPDGPVNAESFAVTPAGVGYVITKSVTGASTVYRLPVRPSAGRVQVLRRVAAISFRPTPTPDPFGVIGQVTATSASISRDGRLLAVRTYSDAYLWPMRDGDVAAALERAPTRVALPEQPQGEGIAIDGNRLLLDSEGVGTAVYSVPIPAGVRAATAAAGPAGTAARTTSGAVPPSASAPRTAAPSRPAGAANSDGGPPWGRVVVGGAAGAFILAGLVAATARRRRRAR